MTSPLDNWRPTPELLAAYFDGECEARDDLSLLKRRIENWLTANPQAQEELAEHRRLLHLWQETSPPEPLPEQWSLMLARLETLVAAQAPATKPGPIHASQLRMPLRPTGLVGAAAAVVAGLAIYFAWQSPGEPPQPGRIAKIVGSQNQTASTPSEAEVDIFPVAHASEVTIVRVEGADAHTLVVGELPLQGMLELVAPGDVILTLIRPELDKNELNPVRLIESSSPMIWAKLESESDD